MTKKDLEKEEKSIFSSSAGFLFAILRAADRQRIIEENKYIEENKDSPLAKAFYAAEKAKNYAEYQYCEAVHKIYNYNVMMFGDRESHNDKTALAHELPEYQIYLDKKKACDNAREAFWEPYNLAYEKSRITLSSVDAPYTAALSTLSSVDAPYTAALSTLSSVDAPYTAALSTLSSVDAPYTAALPTLSSVMEKPYKVNKCRATIMNKDEEAMNTEVLTCSWAKSND